MLSICLCWVTSFTSKWPTLNFSLYRPQIFGWINYYVPIQHNLIWDSIRRMFIRVPWKIVYLCFPSMWSWVLKLVLSQLYCQWCHYWDPVLNDWSSSCSSDGESEGGEWGGVNRPRARNQRYGEWTFLLQGPSWEMIHCLVMLFLHKYLYNSAVMLRDDSWWIHITVLLCSVMIVGGSI